MAVDRTGAYLYILSSEYGLLKVGSGQQHTTTGQVIAQNSRLSIHSGGALVCYRDRLLIRTPILGPNFLLVVDPNTLLV